MRQEYIGVFLEPRVNFLKEFSQKEDWSREFLEEIGHLMDVVDTFSFYFKGESLTINIHKIGFLSILRNDLVSFKARQLEIGFDWLKEEKLAYYIFLSLFGCTRWFYLKGECNRKLPVGTFYFDHESSVFSRKNGDISRFLEMQLLSNTYSKSSTLPKNKSHAVNFLSENEIRYLRTLTGTSFSNDTAEKFKYSIIENIKQKQDLDFDEEYYYLEAHFRSHSIAMFPEGVLLTGWTICEYLINRLFKISGSDITNKKRKEFFNNKNEFPWAFDSKEKLRGYSKLIGRAECTVEHKMELLVCENKLMSSNKYLENEDTLSDVLISLRRKRNNYVHSPASNNSMNLLVEPLFTLIDDCIEELILLIKSYLLAINLKIRTWPCA